MTLGKARALGPASALDELVLDRVADQRRRRIGVELLQRRSAMHLDRLDADRENFCDFSVRTPFGNELDHGLLASRQRSLARFLEQEALKQRLRYLAGEEGLVISQRLDRGDQKRLASDFKRNPRAPASSTSLTRASVSCIVKIRISTLGSLERICRVASTRLSAGRPKSRTATSGRVATASSTACLPSEASATTSHPACDCRIARNPARTTS